MASRTSEVSPSSTPARSSTYAVEVDGVVGGAGEGGARREERQGAGAEQ